MTNNIITQIEKLILKTTEGRIEWKTVGANNLRWVKQDNTRLYTTTLQKQISNPSIPNQLSRVVYALTIQSTNPNEIILQINTNIDNSTFEVMERLFIVALDYSRHNSANIIDKLLEDL